MRKNDQATDIRCITNFDSVDLLYVRVTQFNENNLQWKKVSLYDI